MEFWTLIFSLAMCRQSGGEVLEYILGESGEEFDVMPHSLAHR